jgi:hypothetical protein
MPQYWRNNRPGGKEEALADSAGKWLAGIAATVIGSLVVGYFTDWFGIGGPPNRAVAQVTSLNQFGNQVGQTPSAAITVENAGKKTATNCIVAWRSGGTGNFGPDQVNSIAFALTAAQSQTVNLTASLPWNGTGFITASAWIACSNSRSEAVSQQYFVGP